MSQLEEAEALLLDTGDVPVLAAVIHAMGNAEMLLGRLAGAAARYREALGLFGTSGNPEPLIESFEDVAAMAIAAEQFDLAAELLAASASQRERVGFPVVPAKRDDLQRGHALLRERLDVGALALATERGRARDMTATIALARLICESI